MKLYISDIGISDSIDDSVNEGVNDLNAARMHYFYCPSSFKYYSYVKELRSKIYKYVRELQYINNSLIKSERKYNSLFREEVNAVNRINEMSIPERKGVLDVL